MRLNAQVLGYSLENPFMTRIRHFLLERQKLARRIRVGSAQAESLEN
jgi:hypothetical protein